jgi:hypothetical protein
MQTLEQAYAFWFIEPVLRFTPGVSGFDDIERPNG